MAKSSDGRDSFFGRDGVRYTLCMTQLVDPNPNSVDHTYHYRFSLRYGWRKILVPNLPIEKSDLVFRSSDEQDLRALAQEYVIYPRKKRGDIAYVAPSSLSHNLLPGKYNPISMDIVVHFPDNSKPNFISPERFYGFLDNTDKDTYCLLGFTFANTRPALIPVKRLESDIKPSFFACFLPTLIQGNYLRGTNGDVREELYLRSAQAYMEFVKSGRMGRPIKTADTPSIVQRY